MIPKTAKARVGQRFLAAFRDAGAVEVSPDVLLPADTLLDLYGEDIRARAYVTDDPIRGEVVLRPDFTVPIVRLHMQGGADPARYAYLGEVFRKQDHGDTRPENPRDNEYMQAGFEVFARDRAAADAEVFVLFHQLLAPLRLRAVMGDMGLLRDAVAALPVSALRRDALLHHIWRPARFDRLLQTMTEAAAPLPTTDCTDAPWIGARTGAEMAGRLARLAADAAEAPLTGEAADGLRQLLAIDAPVPQALDHMRALGLPGTKPAIARIDARMAHVAAAGVDPAALQFDASHGRSTMEYYDGMTFTFTARDHPDWPPVASGGRYDLLAAQLGQGAAIPAVGGIVRPGLVAQLEGAS